MEVAQDGVVDGQRSVLDLFEVVANVSQAEMESLQRLELGCYPRRERTDCDVTDVAEEMFDSDLLGFFGFDDGGGVDEGFGRGGAVLDEGG